MTATILGDENRISAILRDDLSVVAAKQPGGDTLLHAAYRSGQSRIVSQLLALGGRENLEVGTPTLVSAEVEYLETVLHRDSNRDRLEAARRYEAIAVDHERPPEERGQMARMCTWSFLRAGDVLSAGRHADELQRLGAHHLLGLMGLSTGDWSSARASFRQCDADQSGAWGEWHFYMLWALVESETGENHEAEKHLRTLNERVAEAGDRGLHLSLSALASAWIGRTMGDVNLLKTGEELARQALAKRHTSPSEEMRARIALAFVAVEANDEESAAENMEKLLPLTGEMVNSEPPAVDRVLGMLARILGRLDDAVRFLETSLEVCSSGLRPELANASTELAETLLQRDESGDRDRADVLLGEAMAVAQSLGMPPLQRRIASLQ